MTTTAADLAAFARDRARSLRAQIATGDATPVQRLTLTAQAEAYEVVVAEAQR